MSNTIVEKFVWDVQLEIILLGEYKICYLKYPNALFNPLETYQTIAKINPRVARHALVDINSAPQEDLWNEVRVMNHMLSVRPVRFDSRPPTSSTGLFRACADPSTDCSGLQRGKIIESIEFYCAQFFLLQCTALAPPSLETSRANLVPRVPAPQN